MELIKKRLGLLLAAVLVLTMTLTLAACSGDDNTTAASGSRKISIVSTIFPQYDWVRQIMGNQIGKADMTLLLDDGVDLHNYQPTTDDIAKIADCDMFIYVGGESDEWVEDALASVTNDEMIAVNLLEVLKDVAKEEELKEGMEPEDHEHEGEEEEEHVEGEEEDHAEEEEHTALDEHIWLSMKNAKIGCDYLAGQLGTLDPDNAEKYKENAAAYAEKLDALDADYQTAVSGAAKKTLLFGDRFPFRYLVDDYGLDYYAAFVGCSAETEASFETIVFLAEKVDEEQLEHIMVIDGSNHSIAQTIAENTTDKNQDILSMDSMQSVTAADVASGVSYQSIMEKNLEVLKQALA